MYHILKQYTQSLALILFLGVGLVFTATPAQAQTQTQIKGLEDIQAGLRVGGDYMSQSVSNVPDQLEGEIKTDPGSRIGFLIGGYATIDFGAPVLVQSELMYIQKGKETTQDIPGVDGASFTETEKLGYLEIPVLAKYQVPMAGGISPNVFAGPSLGFNIGASVSTKCDGVPSQFPSQFECGKEQDFSKRISTLEFGLVLGAGVDYELPTKGTVNIDARYQLGLTDTRSKSDGVRVPVPSYTNRGFMVTAGVSMSTL